MYAGRGGAAQLKRMFSPFYCCAPFAAPNVITDTSDGYLLHEKRLGNPCDTINQSRPVTRSLNIPPFQEMRGQYVRYPLPCAASFCNPSPLIRMVSHPCSTWAPN